MKLNTPHLLMAAKSAANKDRQLKPNKETKRIISNVSEIENKSDNSNSSPF